ncbi:MAG: O-antigen ligase family protein [Fibrobacter sp.]|nr:O-antigen ligase family protein [Fibrobacter sp.]
MSTAEFRSILKSPPLVVWLLLTLYHCGNALMKHVSGVDCIDVLHGMKIYFCIAIFVYWAQIDLVKTLKILYRCFCAYLIVAFLLCGGFGGGRLSGVVYATRIGQTAAVAFFLGAVLLFLKKKPAISLFYHMIIPFVVAILSQTRNAIAMMALVTLGFFASTSVRKGLGVLRVLRLCMLLFLGMSVLTLVVYNSSIYQRSLNKNQQNADSYYLKNNSTGTVFDIIVGDRLVYYVEGWKFFKRSPITGIGMWGFRQRYGGDYPLHSEYMVHLCEGGLIAFSLWLFFLFCCAKNIKEMKLEKGYRLLLMSGLIQFLFCAIYAREFFYEFFYPMIAIFIANPLKVQKQFLGLEYAPKKSC